MGVHDQTGVHLITDMRAEAYGDEEGSGPLHVSLDGDDETLNG